MPPASTSQGVPTVRMSVFPIVLSLAIVVSGCGGSDTPSFPKSTVAVIGDVPYGATPTDVSQSLAHPGLISSMNADTDVSIVMHVGDIHSGKQYCTESYDNMIANDWKALTKPMVYTPGDNEWADCHKVAQGGGLYNAAAGTITYQVDANGNKLSYLGGDPAANLELVRRIFFSQPGKDFTGRMDVHSQAREFDPAFPTDANYVENVWFEKSGVVFVNVNLPGGSNNDNDIWWGTPTMSAAQAQDVANRTAADLRWLDVAFKRAVAISAFAVVIELQADMWNLDGVAASHISQYKQYIDSIAAKAKDFGKPVLLFNGDSHVYRTDNPLAPGSPCLIEPSSGAAAVACAASIMPAGNPVDPYQSQPNGYNVPNFRRIVVHGSTMPLEWVKLVIDPNYDRSAASTATSFGPFSWTRKAVP